MAYDLSNGQKAQTVRKEMDIMNRQKNGIFSPDDNFSIGLRSFRDNRYFVKKIYQILCDSNGSVDSFSTQWRVTAVISLEKLFKIEFKNTRDLRRRVEDYLKHYRIRKGSAGKRIKKARIKKKWTQKQLAGYLGYKSHVPIAYFEKGVRYPPDKVFQWLESEGM